MLFPTHNKGKGAQNLANFIIPFTIHFRRFTIFAIFCVGKQAFAVKSSKIVEIRWSNPRRKIPKIDGEIRKMAFGDAWKSMFLSPNQS